MNTTIIAFFNVLFNYMIQVYLERFESLNCTCAFDPRRDLSKTLLMMFYVIIFGNLFFPNVPLSAKVFIGVFTFIFDIVFVSYIFSMKNNKCSCSNISQDVTTNIFYYYYLLIFFMILLTVTLTLLIIPSNLFMLKNK